ncbi:hypothetical protein M011DRAFT_486471 [Sporormia fimetaria CBS 119925]|uniref:Ecp2 effector protein domain-containing protein n=1 Tax=Sporormia fimetaria CBS 119925 TaxID=1340428 RepID=A0A6A6VCL7_9PLEO|nr:hypothetical protein M011DRAFT_486471 [Sporormia fimetaria CBS 119925]
MKLITLFAISAFGALVDAGPTFKREEDDKQDAVASNGATGLSDNVNSDAATAGALVHGEVNVEIGGRPAFVGTEAHQQIYDIVYNCLTYMCPEWRVANQPACDLEACCRAEDMSRREEPSGQYKKDGYIEICVKRGFFNYNNDIRHTLFELVAGAVRQQTNPDINDDGNCFWQEYAGRKDKEHVCMVGEHVRARAHVGSNKYALLNVHVGFSHGTPKLKAGNGYACQKHVGTVWDHVNRISAPRLSSIFGVPFFDSYVTCH